MSMKKFKKDFLSNFLTQYDKFYVPSQVPEIDQSNQRIIGNR